MVKTTKGNAFLVYSVRMTNVAIKLAVNFKQLYFTQYALKLTDFFDVEVSVFKKISLNVI